MPLEIGILGSLKKNLFPTILISALLIVLMILVFRKIKTKQQANRLKSLNEAAEQKKNNLKTTS